MTNRVLFFAFFAFLLLVLLAPSASFASPVNTSAADQALIEGSFAVGLVGSVVLGVYALLAAFRNVRDALGVGGSDAETSHDLAPHVRGFVDQQSYLDDLAMRLAAEDAARGIDFRDVDTGKTNLDYMRESGLAGEDIDRSQHSEAELSAYDSGLEVRSLNGEREEIFLTPADFDSGADFDPATGEGDGTYQDNQPSFVAAQYSSFESASAAFNAGGADDNAKAVAVEMYARSTLEAFNWEEDDNGSFRMHSINGRPIRIDYADELESAKEDARFDFERNDGLTSAQRSDMKEVRKAQEFS